MILKQAKYIRKAGVLDRGRTKSREQRIKKNLPRTTRTGMNKEGRGRFYHESHKRE